MTGSSDTDRRSASEPRPEHGLKRLHARLHRNPVTSLATKVVVTLIGVAVFGAGVLMLVIPGPGLVGMALGLAILAVEWKWARSATSWMKEKAKAAAEKTGSNPAQRRRRIIGVTATALLIMAAVAAYVAIYDWPSWSIEGWDLAQGIVGFLPELPGM